MSKIYTLKKGRFKKSSINPHERVTILGRTRTGKSFLASILLKSLARKTLVILIDTKDEYKFIPAVPLDKLTTLKKGLYRINQIVMENGYKIDDLRVICEFLSQNLFEVRKGSVILAIEEAGSIIKKSGMLYENMPFFAKMLLQGGGKNKGIIIISQRPAQLHTDILNESEHIICFALSGKHDIEALKHWFEPEWYEDLGKFEFLHYSVKDGEKRHCYRLYATPQEIAYYKKLFGKS